MRNKGLMCIFVIIIIFIIGCRLDMDLWVDNDGGGKGTIKVSGAMITAAELKSKLEEKGFEVASINAENMGVLNCSVKWSDFNKSFSSRKVNDNGSITLDFGKIDIGSITAHVNGKIIQETTKGKILNENTVIFNTGKARLTYVPNKSSISPMIIAIAIIGIGIVVILLVVINSKKKNKLTVVQNTESEVEESKVESDVSYCVKCGGLMTSEKIYCPKCGHKKEIQ